MWKKIGIALAVLLILIAGAGYYLFANLDSYIKAAIEKYGSQATQTDVAVSNVSLSLTSGTGSISGLTVANPPGFSDASAFALGTIAVQLDTSSITGNGPIIINSVNIDAPQISYEVKGLGQGSNLKTLQNNVAAFSSSNQAQAQAQGSSSPSRKEIIRDLTITDGRVSVLAPMLSGRTLSVPLPAIHLTNLGGAGGATPAQIGAQLLTEISRRAAITGAAALTSQIGNLGAGAGALTGKSGGMLKSMF